MSISSSRVAGKLRELTAPQKRQMQFGALMVVLAEMLWLPQAGILAASLGAMTAGRTPDLFLTAGAVLGLGLLRAVLGMIAARQSEMAADAIIAQGRAELLMRAEKRAPGADLPSSAETAALLVDKLAMMRAYLLRWQAARARVMVVPLLIMAVTFPVSWAAGLILMISGPLIPVFMALIGMAAKDASARQMDEISNLNSLLVDRLAALIDIRLLGAQDAMLEDFSTRADRLRVKTMQVLRIAFLSSAVLELFAALGVAMMAVYIGFTLLGQLDFGSWGQALQPAEGIWLLLLAPAFFQPLRDLAAAWHDRVAAQSVAAELIGDEDRQLPTMPGQGGRATPITGDIHLRNLIQRGRAYPDLDIAAGESVAITGPTGSGKTTLLLTLAGILPASGALRIGDRTIDEDAADGWRESLALIPQHVHFLDASLRWNLTLGADFDDSSLAEALRIAQAEHIPARLPQGLDTILGEQGGGVSGGEARRLTIARAALWNRPHVLADEPTADLDDHTARAIIAGLLAMHARGASVIVATHDPRLIEAMDRRVDVTP
ncbi:ABC transporter ATP-binding protein/permease [Paracoccus seriniphilus]|uniref:ABC transporter ATP-binding protein/permease n=1 Tax=Paracoccus seriniphilus TaxID=184748 RepID=UPI000B77C753|nr:ATP-binding cassette domain-containing protein [Paracoccus seriniphilus]WCR12884.1 ATP-binding cassette domain-containing protein [Paracoccus seriniphilus]